jgi:two-component system, LuxR family, sensor kinase FixL
MNWVTIIWSGIAAMCLTLATIHLLVWNKLRNHHASLFFSCSAAALAVVSFFELARMNTQSVEELAWLGRWQHVPQWIITLSIVGFVHTYLRAGRRWLAWLVIITRSLAVVINFIVTPNLTFKAITGLRQIPWLGEQVTIPIGQLSPWLALSQISWLLLVFFILDAARAIWGQGERRRALVVGGGFALTGALTIGQMLTALLGGANLPTAISPSFLPLILAMSYELSRDLIRVGQINQELRQSTASLRESEQRMALAVETAKLGLWVRDLPHGAMWASEQWRALLGYPVGTTPTLENFIARLHPDDRAPTKEALMRADRLGGTYELKYRVLQPDGETRLMASRGRIELGPNGQAERARGVTFDITEQHLADMEAQRHRTELAHLSRVATLGELSGSLAHELNQPLAIILSNAQAAQRLLAQDPPDVAEVRAILTDIVSEDRRAGQVIQRLRSLLKQGESRVELLDINQVVNEVLRLTRSDLIDRNVSVRCQLAPTLPPVYGDAVHLQQVLLNVLLNACDAMEKNAARDRIITITSTGRDSEVRLLVHDVGCGLPPGEPEQIFKPFFTTKPNGLGLGLGICRSMLQACQGRLWAESNADRGTTLHIALLSSAPA